MALEMNAVALQEMECQDDGKFLSFDKEKVQVLTMDQLSRTQPYNDPFGRPIRGIHHYTLLHDVETMAREEGYDVEFYDLFAAQNRDRQCPGVIILPELEKKYGDKAVEAHMLNRVFANIRVKDFDDAENTTNLAIAYHQNGIQAGFGSMVHICHNQCLLGADRYCSTYSPRGRKGDKVNIPELLERVGGWLRDARRIVMEDRETMERMKNIEMTAERLFVIIGMLTAIRVKADTLRKEIRSSRVYPLNQTQINRLTEDMLYIYETTNHITLYNLYASCTDMYKADRMDIPALLPQNLALTEFIKEQFAV